MYLRDATVHNPCELNPINITQRFCVDVKLSNNLNLEKMKSKIFVRLFRKLKFGCAKKQFGCVKKNCWNYGVWQFTTAK